MNSALTPTEVNLVLPENDQGPNLSEQLFRYAEDLQQMIERHGALESNYGELLESSTVLLESSEALNTLMFNSQDIHIITDINGWILQSNPAVNILTSQERITGTYLLNWIQPSHHEVFLEQVASVLKNGSTKIVESTLRLRNEFENTTPIIVSARILAVRKENEKRQLHWIFRDVTSIRKNQLDSKISTMVLQNAVEGVMVTDPEGKIISVNPAFCRITGYSETESIGRNPSFLSSGRQDEAFYRELWLTLRNTGSWQGELFNRKKSGEIYPEWMKISALHDSEGNTLCYVAFFLDQTRQLEAAKNLAHLAHHDPLTGLPNRLLLLERIKQMLAQARRTNGEFTLIFIDLDRFKQINDTLGHAVGDIVLKEAASRLSNMVREVDTVARLGGDEFVILAPNMSSNTDIGQLCNKAIHALCLPMQIENHTLFVGGSFGCAEYPRHGKDETTLLKHADVAMYQAKANGGNGYVIYQLDEKNEPI